MAGKMQETGAVWSGVDVMVKKCVGLTGEEQEELKALVSKGRAAAYKQTHARILMLSDENQDDVAVRGDSCVPESTAKRAAGRPR